jgi:hypothetical protein
MFHCTLEEKAEFLRRRGFTVQQKVVTMTYPGYQNQMDYEDKEVTAVFSDDGKEYCKPGGYNFKEPEWLDAAFQRQVGIVFKEVVLGIREDKPERAGTLDQVLSE